MQCTCCVPSISHLRDPPPESADCRQNADDERRGTFALHALAEDALEQPLAMLAHGRLGVRVDHKCVRDADASRQFPVHPGRTSHVERRGALLPSWGRSQQLGNKVGKLSVRFAPRTRLVKNACWGERGRCRHNVPRISSSPLNETLLG